MEQKDEIKSKIDIVELISEYVPLKRAGTNFKACCPFHGEKTPSFMVSPVRQTWHCFGACQTGGDIYSFLMKIENIEFSEALEILAKRAGVILQSFQPTAQGLLREKIYRINSLALEYYQYLLLSHKVGEEARSYLEKRKILPDSVKIFGIGYSPNSWESLANFLRSKGFDEKECVASGLVVPGKRDSGYDRFRGRLMFSLRDHRGNILGFAGRLMDKNAKEAKYINSPETEVYTKGNVLYGLDVTREEIRKAGFAIVVEGEIDTIQSYQTGTRNVVAIKGSAFTEGQIHLLKRYTENVHLALDADLAGDAAAHRGIQIADSAGLNIKIIRVPDGKDPDECIKKSPKIWQEAVETAIPYYDFVIDSAVAKNNPDLAEGKKKIIAEVSKFISPIENAVVKAHYLKRLSEIIGVAEEIVSIQLEKEFRRTDRLSDTVEKAVEKLGGEGEKKRRDKVEEYLLGLLLQSDDPADWVVFIRERLSPADFVSSARGKIYQAIVENKDRFKVDSFIKSLPEELVAIADKLYLQDLGGVLENQKEMLEEISTAAWDIREIVLRDKLKTISDQLKHVADSEDLEKQFSEVSGQLQKLLKDRRMISSS